MFDSATAPLVDSHVHLDRYTDEEVRRMVARAEAAGVRCLLTVGTDLASSRAALALATRYAAVLAAVGIHPTRIHLTSQEGTAQAGATNRESAVSQEGAMNCAPTGDHSVGAQFIAPFGQLQSLLQQHPAAIGEVGLDEHAPDLEGQAQFLEACLALAEGHALPVVLHVVGERAVHEEALALVARHPRLRTVAHYFVGGPDLARRYLEHGCWISVGRPVTRPSEIAVRKAIPVIPLDRLLLETDTYPLPGRTTEPREVASVCAAVAELAGRSYAEVAGATTASFEAFIGRQVRN
jgi:TatD DNase family protein